jgi:hypothetical protein
VSCGTGLVLTRVCRCKASPLNTLGPFCTQLVPFLVLCHAARDAAREPSPEAGTMLFGPSSHQNHESNKLFFLI